MKSEELFSVSWEQFCAEHPEATTFREQLRILDAMRQKRNPRPHMVRVDGTGKLKSK